MFYSTLRDVAGQKPEMCLKEVTRRLDGSKDYAQVGERAGVPPGRCMAVLGSQGPRSGCPQSRNCITVTRSGLTARRPCFSVAYLLKSHGQCAPLPRRGLRTPRPAACGTSPHPSPAGPGMQVRHYYYRLIKRLNKILGSDARLDIKNPLQVGGLGRGQPCQTPCKLWALKRHSRWRGCSLPSRGTRSFWRVLVRCSWSNRVAAAPMPAAGAPRHDQVLGSGECPLSTLPCPCSCAADARSSSMVVLQHSSSCTTG